MASSQMLLAPRFERGLKSDIPFVDGMSTQSLPNPTLQDNVYMPEAAVLASTMGEPSS